MSRDNPPFCQPTVFSGTADQDILIFLDRFERASKINGWDGEKQALYLPMYLEGPALKYFEVLDSRRPGLEYKDFKVALLTQFAPAASKDLLMLRLNSRVQQPHESVAEYTADVEHLCWLVDPKMQEFHICGYPKRIRPCNVEANCNTGQFHT